MNANAQHHNDNVARNPDHAINRALAALRDASPRAGLNTRVIAALEHRAAAPQPRVRLALWTASSAGILVVASLVMLHHHPRKDLRAAHPFAKAAGWGREADAGRMERGRPAMPELASSRSMEFAHRPGGRAERGAARGSTPVSEGVRAPASAAAADLDAQALADLHAPSHPAPPLPLTAQEKLLLRTLRHGNATKLAELNPAVRAQQNAEETAAFKSFFPDPPPLKQPLGDAE